MPRAKRKAYRTLIHGHSDSPASLVENSLVLSIGEVVGNSPRYQGSIRKIMLTWPKAGVFQFQNTMMGEVDLHNPTKAFLRLRYEIDGTPVDQCVRLTRTEQPFRWWFVCPLENIRVAKLYLPSGARRFASRKAHGLVYKCEVQPKRDMHLSPNAVRSLRRLSGRS